MLHCAALEADYKDHILPEVDFVLLSNWINKLFSIYLHIRFILSL